jgi:uroporphyrinogen decarboxylase
VAAWQARLFWGGVDEGRERIDIFNQDGGFVCNSVHNLRGNSPIENVLAMFKAIQDSRR